MKQILSASMSDGSRHRRRKQWGGPQIGSECVCLCVTACRYTTWMGNAAARKRDRWMSNTKSRPRPNKRGRKERRAAITIASLAEPLRLSVHPPPPKPTDQYELFSGGEPDKRSSCSFARPAFMSTSVSRVCAYAHPDEAKSIQHHQKAP